MNNTQETLYSKMMELFASEDKGKLLLLAIVMIFSAILEMAGVGLIMPFIAIIDKPEIIETTPILNWFYVTTKAGSYNGFLFICSGTIVVFYLLKNIFIGFTFYWQSSFLAKCEAHVGTRLLGKYLSMPYLRYMERNTSELINNITIETSLVFAGLVKPVFLIISDIFVTISILLLLLYITPLATLAAIGGLGLAGVIFYVGLRRPLKTLGESRQYHKQKMVQWVGQSLGSMKEVIILGRKDFFRDSFWSHASQMIKTQKFYETVILLPRLVIESFGVIILVVITAILINSGEYFLPTLSLFAMAAFRLMPSIQRVTSSATMLRYYKKTLDNIHADLTEEYPVAKASAGNEEVNFKKQIILKDIYFNYPESTHEVLKGLNLTVKKGEFVGIIGSSGEGKSTLVDIMLGLLPPQKGVIEVDGVDIFANLRSWHDHISYMPQTIYLTDDTIRRNVALGIADDEIDDEMVKNAINKAQLDEFVDSLEDGVDTMVGEQGTRLSGGQRQRIGIARALYNNPDVLILDEATTALDPATEQRICKTLQSISADITIIAISHQKALIDIADRVYKLKDGVLDLKE